MRPDGSLHAITWLVWALAAAAAVELAPNPAYVAVVIVICAVVVAAHGRGDGLARAFPLLVAVGVSFAVLRIGLTVATTHGLHPDHVLFTTPSFTLPRLLGGFEVGGTVELAVLLQAAAESFTIVGIMAVFGAFNAVVSHHELVRSAPRAFYEPGLVVTVAVAFVPATIATVQRVREADLARTGGRRAGRGRMLRLSVPVLETGMEQAMSLAESMDARGFAAQGGGPAEQTAGWLLIVGLLSLAGSFVALVGRAGAVAGFTAAVGVAALATAAVVASRAAERSRYRPRPMAGADRVVCIVSLIAPAVLIVLAAGHDHSLVWSATPLHLPGLNAVALLALMALAIPGLRPSPPSTSIRPAVEATVSL